MRLITSGLVIIGMAGFIYYNLMSIAYYGEVLIRETNLAVLIAESLVVGGAFGYGIYLFITGIRERLSK